MTPRLESPSPVALQKGRHLLPSKACSSRTESWGAGGTPGADHFRATGTVRARDVGAREVQGHITALRKLSEHPLSSAAAAAQALFPVSLPPLRSGTAVLPPGQDSL